MTDKERYIRDKASVMAMVKFILMVAIATAICLLATKIVVVLVPFLIGFLLSKTAYAFSRGTCKLVKKEHDKRLRKRLSIIYYVFLLIVITIAIVWCCVSLFAQASRALDAISNLASQNIDITTIGSDIIAKYSVENGGFLTPTMRENLETNMISLWNDFVDQAPSLISGFIASAWKMIGNIPYGIFVVICVILSGYYFINDGPNVLKFYTRNVPNKTFRVKSISLINDLSVTLFRAIGGYLLLLIITTVEAWCVFKLAGVDYAVLLALITGIIDFMPVLGVSATMIPVMIYCAIHGNYTGIVILIIGMAVMTVIRRFIEPPILGKTLHLHPLLMLLAMALGVYIWGAIGFLLGPVVTIIIIDILQVFDLDKKFMDFMGRVLGNLVKKPENSGN